MGRELETYKVTYLFSAFMLTRLLLLEKENVSNKKQKIADRARMMQIHGIDRQPFNRYKSKPLVLSSHGTGFKYNMTD